MTTAMSRRSFVATAAAAPLTWRLGVRQRQEHVVVVGAGAFGGWTALALLRAGMRVTRIDAWGAGHSRASAGGETRVMRGAYGGVPIYSEMAARARVRWREAEAQRERQAHLRSGAAWM